MKRKTWQDFTPGQRAGIIVLSIGQIALLIAALRDLHRRPAVEIKGSKKLWTMLVFANYVGPLAYFFLGRQEAGCCKASGAASENA